MKLGPFEGSPEEIKNYFKGDGHQVGDYIALPEAPISTRWFVIPSAAAVLAIAVLVFLHVDPRLALFVFLLGCAASCWLAVNAQLRFKSPWATGLILLAGLLLMLVAFGALSPMGLLEEAKQLRK